jgi:hypothetical protein
MGKVALVAVGTWMIGDGIDGLRPPTMSGVLKVVAGIIMLFAAFGVDF